MNGLSHIPQPSDFIRAYNKLQSDTLSEEDVLEYFQWVRFDPRLGEMIVQKIQGQWRLLNPLILHQGLIKTQWPSVLGVLLDMVQIKISKDERTHYLAWKNCILFKVKKMVFQQFFIGLTAFAGKSVSLQLKNSNKIFRKWNFYGTQLFFNKDKNQKIDKSLISKAERLRILEQYIQENNKSFRVTDYLNILPAPVSRRVAELDLKNHPLLLRKGFTQNRVYIKK